MNWSFVWKLCLEVLDLSFVWKFWLEALNRYVIFILLLGEYLIETFFVLKYVAWYFYIWYVELVCLFEYWVCIFVLVIFHWACCQYRWFLYALVSCVLLLGNADGNIEMYIGIFSFNLFVTHDIFIAYFFVIRILFWVIDRISVCVFAV